MKAKRGGRGWVIVVAHPDDETLGASALLPDTPLAVIHVTDGAPRDPGLRSTSSTRAAYAARRAREVRRALAIAGVPAARIACLRAVDQEAVLEIPRLAAELARRLARLSPRVVVTHPYEGGHPDHDATACAVHAAVRRLGPRAPRIVEAASYHGAGGGFSALSFVPGAGPAVAELALPAPARRRKAAMLACFESQRAVVAAFPIGVERFRAAPAYDFERAPHPGQLLYERLGWPMTGSRWRALAGAGLRAMGEGTWP